MTRQIGAALRELRRARGLTQAELAESCDVAVEAYGRLERGAAFPRADTVLRLAAALECTTDEIFGLVAQRAHGDSNAVRGLLHKVRMLDPRAIRSLSRLADDFVRLTRRRSN